MKNNLPWFRHYAEAPDHPKFEALRAVYGWAGEGRFWALNCYIARADGCRLDLRPAFLRARIANKFGLTAEELTAFLDFLSDRDRCGLLQRENEIYFNEITQEDFGTMAEKRVLARRKYQAKVRTDDSVGKTGDSDDRKGLSNTDSRREEKRKEAAAGEKRNGNSDVRNGVSATTAAAAACSLFSPSQIQERLAFASLDVTLDDAAACQVAQALQAAGCEDLGYLDWALERISARANGKPINNPAGYLLSVVGLPDWISAWRHERELRAAVCRQAEPSSPAKPSEPDDPAAVAQLLEELPWKPGGMRKHAPAPDVAPASSDSGGPHDQTT